MDDKTNSLLQPNQNAVVILRQFAKIGSLVTALIGLLCLVDWQFTLSPFFSTSMMNPLSGIGFLCSGSALFLLLQKRTQSKLTQAVMTYLPFLLSWITAFVGFVMVLNFIGIIHSNLDQILFTNKLAGNRISPNSSFNFFVIGIALLFLQFHSKKYFTRIAQLLTLVAAIISMFAVIGYIYNALSLYKIVYLAPMPFSSALTFSMLCLAILFARSEHGITKILTRNTPSSTLALRLIVITLTLPAVVGYLLSLSAQLHLFNIQTEIALLVIGNIVLLSIIIWVNTRTLQHIELENLLIKNELEKNNVKLEINAQELSKKTLSLEEENKEIVDKLDVRDKLLEVTDEYE